MDQTAETPQAVKTKKLRSVNAPRRKMQKTRSFTDALKEKYCSQDNDQQSEFIIHIVVSRRKPKLNESASAELAHLRNVVLSNRRVSSGGLPDTGLATLCPNVTELDLSSNLFESWEELLPLMSQLPHLKFLNLSRNHITRHKEELWRWTAPLPKVENLVLNSTGIPLREVLALAHLMPALRELHICCNYYRDLGSVEVAIKEGALSKLECLRLNENIITSWSEVWKLRDLPCLTQLILSENPLCDVFYDPTSQTLDSSLCEMDSPDITCHSDGEDSNFGSPRFRYPVGKVSATVCGHVDHLSTQSAPSLFTSPDHHAHRHDYDHAHSSDSQSSYPLTSNESHLINDIIDNLISHACQRTSIQESCEECGQNSGVKEVNRAHRELSDLDFAIEHFVFDDIDDRRPCFYLGNTAEDLEGCCAECGEERNEQDACLASVDEHTSDTEAAREAEEEMCCTPFANLHTLCLSRTSVCETDHLMALNEFPQLTSLRIMDIALYSHVHQEDRRKLYVASLPRLKTLNGSEVTITERDKAERFFLRHFCEQEEKSKFYMDLEKKHGPIQPLRDIDLGARFQKEVNLTFMLDGVEQFKDTVSVLQPVGKLRLFIAQRLAIPRKSFKMFHNACGPYQSEEDRTIDELFLDGLPMSRFDLMDGDEILVEIQ